MEYPSLMIQFGRICLLILFLLCSVPMTVSDSKDVKIGVIINQSSTVGKVQKAAMETALQRFNYSHLSLIFNAPRTPLSSSYAEAAEELLNEHKANVIIGMNRWEDAISVADIGSRANVPVLSFSTSLESQDIEARWPFLVRMARNESAGLKCIAAILRTFNWTRVVPVYEGSTNLPLFEDIIREVSAEIEHNLVLPSLSEFHDPKQIIEKSLMKIKEEKVESRVFIVLSMSTDTVVHLVSQAKEMGFMENETVWIFSESVTNSLDLVNTSVISSMEGALGIMSYYRRNSPTYNRFREEMSEPEPGFYAVRAYDSVAAIAKAIEKIKIAGGEDDPKPNALLNAILASNFTGLSGDIIFMDGGLAGDSPKSVINVAGTRYREIGFWLPDYRFSKTPFRPRGNYDLYKVGGSGSIVWPGWSMKIPRGWVPPMGKIIVGVPGRTVFDKFVKVINKTTNEYSGFCVELFEKVVENLGYPLKFEFRPINGSYEDLVDGAFNKVYDVIVGDFTILPWRLHKVRFTPAWMESSLAMIVPSAREDSAWIFIKPFTTGMWVATGALLLYIMLAVWFMERRGSEDFTGSWWKQIGIAIYFTLASLFFVQREKLKSPLSRVVIIVWLFVVLIFTSSFTANLSSMLTIRELYPAVTDIKWLAENNKKVGCDSDSFLYSYLIETHRFDARNIVNITNEHDYIKMLENGNISSAFFELPYQKAFSKQYCTTKFVATTYNFRFGGLAFGFAKRTQLFEDVSIKILELMQKGEVKRLSDKYFSPAKQCMSGEDGSNAKLGIQEFKGLFVISVGTTTVCLVLFGVHRVAVRRCAVPPTKTRKLMKFRVVRSRQSQSRRLAALRLVT